MNTDESTEKPSLVRIAERLRDHGVEFMVIGGQAAVLLGAATATFDVDLCYRRTKDNLRRLAEALKELHPSLRGAPPDLPFSLDADSLGLGANFTFDTDEGPLDLLSYVEPFESYEALVPGSEVFDAGGIELRVIGLEDLITVKRHLRRPKDQATLAQLEALQRIREEEARG